MQRAFDNAESRREHGRIPETSTITTREALSWITVEGAKMLRMFDRIGSLSPGKQADIVAFDARQINMQPVHDPVSSVVMQADLVNVEAVMVAGEWRKRDGRLLAGDIAGKAAALARSGHRIAAEMGLRTGLGMIFERRVYTLRPGKVDAFWDAQGVWNTPVVFGGVLERNLAYFSPIVGDTDQIIHLYRFRLARRLAQPLRGLLPEAVT